MDKFLVLDVSSWPVRAEEPAGDDQKEWLNASDGQAWLFKPRTEKRSWSQGEDWAEKIAAEIAAELEIPSAAVELAVRDGVRGLISRNLRPSGWELQTGDVVLFELLGAYEAKSATRQGHTLDNIGQVLRDCEPPPNYENTGELSVAMRKSPFMAK